MRSLKPDWRIICALCAVILASPLTPYLPGALWASCDRLRRYTIYGTGLTLVGLGLLYVSVSHLGINLFVAQMLLVPLVMAAVSYFVHRHKSFGDRRALRPYSKTRYVMVRAGGMGVSKLSFLTLVMVVGVQYVLASIIITAALAGPSYKLNRDWAFAAQRIGRVEGKM